VRYAKANKNLGLLKNARRTSNELNVFSRNSGCIFQVCSSTQPPLHIVVLKCTDALPAYFRSPEDYLSKNAIGIMRL
jgi:hypothetical protein